MARGVTLKRFAVTNVSYLWTGAYRLRVEASLPVGGMDANVFLYNRNPLDPATGETIDEFLTVASAVDMSEYPIGAPASNTDFPFFRLSWLELDFRAVVQAERVWETVYSEVCALCTILDKLEELVLIQTVQCASTEPVLPTSASTSDSDSSSLSGSSSDSDSGSQGSGILDEDTYFSRYYWTPHYWPVRFF